MKYNDIKKNILC